MGIQCAWSTLVKIEIWQHKVRAQILSLEVILFVDGWVSLGPRRKHEENWTRSYGENVR